MIVKIPIEVTQTGDGLKATIAGMQEIEKSAKRAQGSAKDLGTAIKGFAAGFISVAAVKKAADEMRDAANWAEKLGKGIKQTGIESKALQQIITSAEALGYTADDVTTSIARMSRAIAENDKGLKRLGLSFTELRNATPEEQLRMVAQAISNMGDPTERSAAAMEMFGRSGASLIPLLGEIASGAYKMNDALGDEQVAALSKADAALDKFDASWKLAKRSIIGSIVDIADSYNTRLLGMFGISANNKAGGISFAQLNALGSASTYLDRSELAFPEAPEGYVESRKAAAEAAKHEREEQERIAKLMAEAKRNQWVGVGLQNAMNTLNLDLATRAPLIPTNQLIGQRDIDMLNSALGPGPEMGFSMVQTQRVIAVTKDWGEELNTLANQLSNLSQVTSGFAGKLLGIASALSSGAGGVMSGIKGWSDAGQKGGIMGFLGKFSSGLGIVGSAIGAIGGLVGGIKSLFGGKSKEEKAAEAAAKAQAEADRKAALEEAQRMKIEGLKSAQSAAEALMDRMGKGGMSEALTASLGTLVGKVQEALLASGLGYMATGGLRESEAFMGAQGAAGDVARLIAGMRAGGALDAGLLGAAGQSAVELRAQAVEAAKAAGMEDAAATKAGFGAIAPLLREQLNAAIASGQELDANTRALIEEAKANGITILADPMVESVSVQKAMLTELKRMNGNEGGSPDASFASGTRGLRLVKRDMLARIHRGEGMLVVPREEMVGLQFRSFLQGSDSEDPGTWGGHDGTVPVIVGPTTGSSGGMTGGGGSAQQMEESIRRAVGRITPVRVESPVSVQVVDQSVVKTVEGQRAFGRYVVAEVERALDQSRGSLRVMIERISRQAVA